MLKSFPCFLTQANSGRQSKLCKFNHFLLIFYEGNPWSSQGWHDSMKPPIKSKYSTHVTSSEPPCTSSPPLVGEAEMAVTCLLEYSVCRTKQYQQLGHRSINQYNVSITSCYSPYSPKSPSSNIKEWIQSYYTHTYTPIHTHLDSDYIPSFSFTLDTSQDHQN